MCEKHFAIFDKKRSLDELFVLIFRISWFSCKDRYKVASTVAYSLNKRVINSKNQIYNFNYETNKTFIFVCCRHSYYWLCLQRVGHRDRIEKHQWNGNPINSVVNHSDDDMGTVYLYNVGTGKFLNAGSYWGTVVIGF